MLWARTDDSGSQWVLRWTLPVAVVLVGGLVLFFLAAMTNRLLGVESTIPAVVAGHEVLAGARSDTHRFHFTTSTDRQFSTVIPKSRLAGLGLKKGEEVELVLDGLFWSEVVEVRKGDQVYKKYP